MLKKFSTSWREVHLRYKKNALYRFLSFLIFRIFRQFKQFNFQNCSNNSHNLYLYIVCISEHCIVRPSNYHFWKYFPERLFAKHLFLVNSYPQEHLYLSTGWPQVYNLPSNQNNRISQIINKVNTKIFASYNYKLRYKSWHKICYNYIEKITEKIKIFLKKVLTTIELFVILSL